MLGCSLVILGLMAGCATHELPPPRSLRVPVARFDGQGRYVCPYTSDHVLAEWVDMQIKAGAWAAIGGGVGGGAGAAAAGSALGVWSIVLKKVGESIGRRAAIRAAGGMDHIRTTSDVSFDDLDDLAVYLYQFYSAEETYSDALSAAVLLYPELEDRYVPAIKEAQK